MKENPREELGQAAESLGEDVSVELVKVFESIAKIAFDALFGQPPTMLPIRFWQEGTGMKWITANDMAGKSRTVQKSFRRALRDAHLPWHMPNARWKVPFNGDMHRDMKRVFEQWRKHAS